MNTDTSNTTAKLTILVTGATGTIGSGVISRLQGTDAHVRAFVRDPEAAHTRLGEASRNVELVQGDFADPETVLAAMQGVDAVFLACGNVPGQVAYECAVIDAARQAGVQRIVKLSARGADHRASNAYWRTHAEIEDHLAGSGIPSVVLRPSFLMSNLFGAADHIRHMDTLMAPAGSAGIAMIDPTDVSEIAALALTQAIPPQTLVLTGPEAMSYQQVAGELSDLVGRSITYVDVPQEAMMQGLIGAGVPEMVATQVVRVFSSLSAGDQTETTDAVVRFTGHAGGTFADFVRRHAAVFEPSLSTTGQS